MAEYKENAESELGRGVVEECLVSGAGYIRRSTKQLEIRIPGYARFACTFNTDGLTDMQNI